MFFVITNVNVVILFRCKRYVIVQKKNRISIETR